MDFEALYKEYFHDVYLFLFGLSKDEHIAEELTEEAFFRALRALDDFQRNCDIRVWLCQIAKNEYYQYLRKTKRLVTTDFSEESTVSSPYTSPLSKPLEEQLIDSETAVRIHRLLHDMPDPYKEVFYLRVFGELSFEQIGDIFHKNANWACVTYHRARSKIQKQLEENHE